MPRNWAKWAMAALLALLFAACRASGGDPIPPTASTVAPMVTPTSTPTAAAETVLLNGTRWLLTSLHGADIGDPLTIELSFTHRQAGGYIGCSSYGGAYTSDVAGSFEMPEVFTNAELCELPDDLASFADLYFGALESAASYRVIDAQLALSAGDGSNDLVFARDTRDALDGTSWRAAPVSGRPIIDNTHMTAKFSDGQVTGSASCNDYSATYSIGNDGSFSVDGLAVTEMACSGPEDIMVQEQRFLDALTAAASYEYDVLQNSIKRFDVTGQLRMGLGEVGERLPMSLPAWSAWVLADINGQPVDTKPKITMLFSNGLLGDADCLGYSAYIITRPNGEIPYLHGSYPYSPMDWYDGDCGEAGPSPEAQAYRAALESVTHYSLAADRFEFLNADGAVVLGYAPSLTEGTGLEDTSWTLLRLGDVPVIEHTGITLIIQTGAVHGMSGCNWYSGPYIVAEPGVIAFPWTASTAMACPDGPAGIIEQETAYQAAFSNVAAYRVTDTQLELLDADGTAVLVFEADGL